MVIAELLAILKGIATLPLEAFSTAEVKDCILYNLVPLTSNGILEQNRLELTIITRDYGKGASELERIKSGLLTMGDDKKTDNILNISLSGGGCMKNYNPTVIYHKAYFIITNLARR